MIGDLKTAHLLRSSPKAVFGKSALWRDGVYFHGCGRLRRLFDGVPVYERSCVYGM